MTQTKEVLKYGGFVLLVLLIAFGYFLYAEKTFGSVAVDTSANVNSYKLYNLFASSTNEAIIATTTTATSTNLTSYADSSGRIVDGTADIRGAKSVVMLFQRGDTLGTGNAGSSLFKVQVTADGTNWQDYQYLRPVTSTSTTNTLFAANVTAAAGTSTQLWYLPQLGFSKLRCIVVETTDGDHSCGAAVTY